MWVTNTLFRKITIRLYRRRPQKCVFFREAIGSNGLGQGSRHFLLALSLSKYESQWEAIGSHGKPQEAMGTHGKPRDEI